MKSPSVSRPLLVESQLVRTARRCLHRSSLLHTPLATRHTPHARISSQCSNQGPTAEPARRAAPSLHPPHPLVPWRRFARASASPLMAARQAAAKTARAAAAAAGDPHGDLCLSSYSRSPNATARQIHAIHFSLWIAAPSRSMTCTNPTIYSQGKPSEIVLLRLW
jgi:hypothetical protein